MWKWGFGWLRKRIWPESAAAPHLLTTYVSTLGWGIVGVLLPMEAAMWAMGPDYAWMLWLPYTVAWTRAITNACLADSLLRLHLVSAVAATRGTAPSYRCETCRATKLIHRLEDVGATGLLTLVGTIAFVWGPWAVLGTCSSSWGGVLVATYLHVTWRAFQHAQTWYGKADPPMCIHLLFRDGRVSAMGLGILRTAMEVWGSRYLFPSLALTLDFVVAAAIDARCAAAPLPVPVSPTPHPIPVLFMRRHIEGAWVCTHMFVVGACTVAKRRRRPDQTLARTLHQTYSAWKQTLGSAQVWRLVKWVLLWPEFDSLQSAVHSGPLASLNRLYAVKVLQGMDGARCVIADHWMEIGALSKLLPLPVIGRVTKSLLWSPEAKAAATILTKLGTRNDVSILVDTLYRDIRRALDVSVCIQEDEPTATLFYPVVLKPAPPVVSPPLLVLPPAALPVSPTPTCTIVDSYF